MPDERSNSYSFFVLNDSAGASARLGELLEQAWPDCRVKTWDPLVRGIPSGQFDWSEYDVVFLDNDLGIGQGLVFLRDFKLSPQFPASVMLAEKGDEILAMNSIKSGIDYYLPIERLSKDAVQLAVAEAEKFHKNSPVSYYNLATHVRGYRILKRVGHGGRSIVYLAMRNFNRSYVVIKLVYLSDEESDRSVEHLLNEYALVRNIDHANVVSVYEQGKTSDTVYMVMEYCGGGTLHETLEKGRLEKSHAIYYFLQIAQGLEAIHKNGIIHRDIKAENILFRQDGSLAIIDFGIAETISRSKQLINASLTQGTPHYMSPEQASGRSMDERSDIYSLGCIFYELLSGEKPFVGIDAKEVIRKHMTERVPTLPKNCREFQGMLEIMMAKNADLRFFTVTQLLKMFFEANEDTIQKPAGLDGG